MVFLQFNLLLYIVCGPWHYFATMCACLLMINIYTEIHTRLNWRLICSLFEIFFYNKVAFLIINFFCKLHEFL
ncbi:hypothetical protein IHE45_06G038000 [Dioscorea alata]|uniref:Uncharacterized protein n=1 Tax=Dioscorea alata TaxID=55571 RepID=A0ACB7VWR6_DIOAL|nr:hypothetical protein IHE45_06G038000 [Dioscorea alata]